MKERPLGVTVYSFFLIGSGIWLLLMMLPRLWKETTAGILDPGYLAYLAGYWLLVAAGVALFFVLGTGLFKLRNWARQLIVNLALLYTFSISPISLLAIGVNQINAYTGPREVDAITWFTLGLGPATLYYFLRPAVKAQFRKTG